MLLLLLQHELLLRQLQHELLLRHVLLTEGILLSTWMRRYMLIG